jgi:hypothetical protein
MWHASEKSACTVLAGKCDGRKAMNFGVDVRTILGLIGLIRLRIRKATGS